jgi:hypothetical protein
MTTNNNNDEEPHVDGRPKIIQDFKRRMLNIELEQYEIEIQHYEYLYEQELDAFKSETFKINSFYQISRFNMLIHFVKTYVYHHTNLLIRQIRYKESCLHVKLIRHQRRCQSVKTNKIIDVYPQIIVDIPKVSLNSIQLEYLSRTGGFELLFHCYRCHDILFHLQDPIIFDQIRVIFIRTNVDRSELNKNIKIS